MTAVYTITRLSSLPRDRTSETSAGFTMLYATYIMIPQIQAIGTCSRKVAR